MKKQIYPKGQDQESPRVRQDDLPFFLPEVTVTTSPMASEPELRFRRCLERITRGLVAFLDIAEPLQEIKRDKLFLLPGNADGQPLYPTFSQFLKDRLSMNNSTYCKICKAHETYMRLKEHYGDRTDERLGDLKSLASLYELSQVPPERLPEAFEAITAGTGQTSPTAGDVTRWRQTNVLPEETGRRLGRPHKTASIPCTPSLFNDAEDDDEEPQPTDDEDAELDNGNKPAPEEQLYSQLTDLLGNYVLVRYVAQEQGRFEAVSNNVNSFFNNMQELMAEQYNEEQTHED